jgi:hypothetical protein
MWKQTRSIVLAAGRLRFRAVGFDLAERGWH